MSDDTRSADPRTATGDGPPIRIAKNRRNGAKSPEAPKVRGAKAGGGQTRRAHLTLSGELLKRLGVHSTLSGTQPKDVVERVLMQWLRAYGQGRELWPADGRETVSDSDTGYIGQDSTAA